MKIFCAMLLMGALTLPSFAHHRVAGTFDESKATTLHGVITVINWANPHVNITMEVKYANGAVTTWLIGLGAPNALYRDGIRMELFEVMKAYSLAIWPARDGSRFGTGRSLTTADGRTFDAHDRWGDVDFTKVAR